jgi:hypothetical protein
MAAIPSPDKVYEACLVELYKTLRAASFYAVDHPALGQSVTRSLRYFQNLLRMTERIEFTITKTQILVHERPILGQPKLMATLSGELFRRRIKKLIFLAGINEQDMLGFIRAFSMEPDELARRGGMEDMIARGGVRSIWANQVNFQRLNDLDGQDEDTDGEEEIVDGALEEEEPEPLNLTPEQKALRELLNDLLRSDDAEFMRLLKEMVDRCKSLSLAGAHAEVGVALDYLFRFSNNTAKSITAREFAEKAIRALAGKEVLQVKIKELEAARRENQRSLEELFQYIGKVTLPYLFNALSMADGRVARSNLALTITSFGEKAIPRALESLEDDRWFVIRNVLAILAQVGSSVQLPVVLPYLEHPDVRVVKEAAKTVARIGGEEGLEALRRLAPEADPDIQAQVVTIMGGLRWAPGRLVIERLARKGGSDQARMAACEALGKIRAPESYAVLALLYQEKGLLNREKKVPLRRAALRALVNYGNQAEPLLRKALDDNDLELQGTARMALERLASGEPTA